MIDLSYLGYFVVTALVVLVLPGPGVLYVVTRSLNQGKQAGLISTTGLSVGSFLQVLLAAGGLSAVLITSIVAFEVVKILGAAYLIYLGVRAILSSGPANFSAPKPDSNRRIFADGLMVSLLNPKSAAFFLAFIPQFISAELGNPTLQFILFGAMYVGLALLTDGIYALMASQVRQRLSNQFLLGNLPRYMAGVIYIVLGVGLALSDRKA